MKIRYILSMAALALFCVRASGATLVNDTFSGTALETHWKTHLTPGASATVSDGKVTLDINAVNNQYRAFLSSQNSAFNFYDGAMTVTATGLDLRGTASSAVNATWFFFGIADTANVNQLYPLEAANGQFFVFKRILSGANQITQLYSIQKVNGARTDTVLGNFSTAIIGGVEITMDGNDWSIDVTNPGGGALGSGFSKTFAGLETNYSAFNFVMGTFNNVTPTVGGSMDIGEIQITSTIPEPASANLILMAVGVVFLVRRGVCK